MEVLKTHVRSAKDDFSFTLILTPLRSPPIGAILLLILCGKHGVGVVSVDSTRASYHGFVPSPIAAALSKANKYSGLDRSVNKGRDSYLNVYRS